MRSPVLVILLFLIGLLSFGVSKVSYDKDKDFRFFTEALKNKEGKIDLHTEKDSIERYFIQLKEQLSSSPRLQDQFKLYCKTLNKIQCGHTQIYPNKKLLREWLREENGVTIDYYLLGKRLFVGKLESADLNYYASDRSRMKEMKSIPVNAEIIELNGKSVDELMQDIAPFISSDEDQIEFKYYQASQFVEFYRHLSDPLDADSIGITYVIKGDTVTTSLRTGRVPVHSMRQRIYEFSRRAAQAETEFGEFKIIKQKYGYFRFKSFVSGGGNNYEAFLAESFQKLQDGGIEHLVIDLRGNLGGVMQYDLMRYFIGGGVKLGTYVVEKPSNITNNKYIKKFQMPYLRHKRISKSQQKLIDHGNFNGGTIETPGIDEDLIFTGDVVVITDEGTFSSASMLACHLKTLKGAKIVGRTAGGSFYKGNSGTLTVKLPDSGFMFFVNPNTFYSHLSAVENPRQIKEPDVELNPSLLDRRKLDEYYYLEAIKLFD